MTEIDRRTLLRNAAAGSVLIAFGGAKALDHGSPVEPSLSADPFTLGVASGDPLPDSVVLWTRLAPDPLTPSAGSPESASAGRTGRGRRRRHQRVVRRGRSPWPPPTSPTPSTSMPAASGQGASTGTGSPSGTGRRAGADAHGAGARRGRRRQLRLLHVPEVG